MKYIYYYEYSVGKIGIVEDDNKICEITTTTKPDYELKETPIIKKANQQLLEYFAGKRKTFDLPLAPQGTEFQLKCWQALQTIPYGETWSYKQLAIAVGNEKACRAVGGANNKNPIMIVIPCHRVIGANGSLVGFGGGLPMKEALLSLESKYK